MAAEPAAARLPVKYAQPHAGVAELQPPLPAPGETDTPERRNDREGLIEMDSEASLRATGPQMPPGTQFRRHDQQTSSSQGLGRQVVQEQVAGEEPVVPTWPTGREPEKILWSGAAQLTAGQLRLFLEHPQDVEARRHIFGVAWEINDSMNHHFCGPGQPVAEVAPPPPDSISLPLSFWQRLHGPHGRQADSSRRGSRP